MTLFSSSFAAAHDTQQFIPTSTQQNSIQPKINLLFSDSFVDKKKKLPMPERYYSIVKQLEIALNIEFNIQLYPWNRAVNIAESKGELIFGLSKTPDRLAIFTFSDPVAQNYIWLVTRADKVFPYTKIEDLKGKTIDIFRGAKYGGEFDKNKDILFKIEESSGTYSQRLLRLHLQRVDAMIFSSEYSQSNEVEKQIYDIVKNELQQDNEDKIKETPYNFKVLPIPVTKDILRFAILTGRNEELINNINRFIKKLQTSSNKSQ